MRLAIFVLLVAQLSFASLCFERTGKVEEDQKLIDALSQFQSVVTRITAHNHVNGFSALNKLCYECPANEELACSVFAELENGTSFVMQSRKGF